MSTTIDVLLPVDQAEGTRSQVLRWLKAVGDPVKRHEPLVEIETDKVTVEVPAPADGVLREIAAAEGTDVEPGALLGRVAPMATGSVSPSIAPTSPPSPKAAAESQAAATAGHRASSDRMSPAVRRLLAEHGLDADAVRASGEGGRITVDDVLVAVARRAAPAAKRKSVV